MSPSTPGDAALSVPVSPPQGEKPVPVPMPEQGEGNAQAEAHTHAEAQVQVQAHVQGHGQEQGLLPDSAPSRVAVPQAPGGVKPPAAGDEARAGVLSTSTTPVPSIEKYVAPDQNDKWPKGPVSVPATASTVSKRPNGPSLLTQQLAEARGILPPVTGQSLDAILPSSRLQQTQYDLPIGSYPKPDLSTQSSDTGASTTIDDPEVHGEGDGNSITPRASPRAIAMATSSAVSTISLPPRVTDTVLSRTLDTSEIGDVEPRLRNHRELFRPGGRGMSLERTDRERRLKELAFTTRTYSDTSVPPSVASVMTSDRDSMNTSGRLDPNWATDQRSPTRPRKPDHRLSLGPEKAWQIGSEDLNNAQNGQVEKSIAEVLAGVEPNARSRKASHSLRFFKEGLPEEKLKRKDSRLGQKEKLSVTDDVLPQAAARGGEQAKSLQPSPGPAGEFAGRLTRTRTFPLPSADTRYDDEEPMDYFKIRPGDKGVVESTTSLEEESGTTPYQGTVDPSTLKADEEAQEGSRDAGVEDGELSGEEKISSAVFVPHKGPQDVPDDEDEPEADCDAPVISHQRKDGGSSWLVKADEPEADDPSTPEVQAESKAWSAAHQEFESQHLNIGEDQQTHAMPVQSASVEHDVARETESKSSNQVSPGFGDYVHDHQLDPNQPRDAIELVPYRHQVGGHTTLWRFSKRAVCKKLNNRENEFYEQIEKHHRDLLPFLPRYIGVLNVTFSKQPRRKSTVRRDMERKNTELEELGSVETNKSSIADVAAPKDVNLSQAGSHTRMISQSLQSGPEPIPTVTFLDNQHILPRSLLQPAAKTYYLDRVRSSSVSVPASHYESNGSESSELPARPTLEDRHANSWGTTVVNKKLRHEVFNDAFLKQPINVQRHKKAHQRTIPRKTLDRLLRPASSDSSLMRPEGVLGQSSPSSDPGADQNMPSRIHQKTVSDLGPSGAPCEASDGEPNDVTGTSAPEPDILSESMTPQRRKRRHSGSALRRRPKDVSESRGNLRYWEEPDEAGYKGDNEGLSGSAPNLDTVELPPAQSLNDGAEAKDVEPSMALSTYASTVPSLSTSPTSEFKKIPRPVNPKEAQTQRDSRVSYFLLLEDLTAGMKKPCIMDLKMGTRQYGVEANVKKQKSQQRKCAQTTSRELGVRVCGLQVWDAKMEEYVFRDKYYGRSLQAGQEFQDALTRFLYDGLDRSSILRHIPAVLQKLSRLEVIVRRLRGYRFYAASLLVTYDGDQSDQENHDTTIEDSTTDFATDNEDMNYARKRKNKREIDFKIADFANSLTPQDLAKDKPCPPQHPDEPDRGFLKGLRSLRRYFLKIQQDTRTELGLSAAQRHVVYDPQMDVSEGDESVSE